MIVTLANQAKSDQREQWCKRGFMFSARYLPGMKALLCLFVFMGLGVPASPAFAREALEQQKIDYLIESIAQMHDATFIRNGSEYDAQHAADHMRMKLRYAGTKVQTAEDFIVCCGTGSSMSGKPYAIRFADGRVMSSADFLREKLAAFRAPEPPAQQEEAVRQRG